MVHLGAGTQCVEPVAILPGVMTTFDEHGERALDAWVHEMEVAALSRRTIAERIRVVRAMSRDQGISPVALTSGELSAWLRAVPVASSRATYFQVLTPWSRYLVRSGVRDDDPMLRVPRPKTSRGLPRPASHDQMRRLLCLDLHPDTRAKVLLGAYAGLRVHEIAKVSGRDFQVSPGQIKVVGKGARVDFLPVHPLLRVEAERRPRGLWFPSPVAPDRPVRPSSVSTVISTAFARAGASATAHQLRHWFATTLLESGVDVRVVQELIRHSSLATTAIYTRVNATTRRQAIDALPLLGQAEGSVSGQLEQLERTSDGGLTF